MASCEFAASAQKAMQKPSKTNGQPRGSSTPTPVVLQVCNGQSAWLERMEDSGGSEHLENFRSENGGKQRRVNSVVSSLLISDKGTPERKHSEHFLWLKFQDMKGNHKKQHSQLKKP